MIGKVNSRMGRGARRAKIEIFPTILTDVSVNGNNGSINSS